MSLDPQTSWLQWVATAVVAAFSSLLGLFVASNRDAFKIYREKVDALEQKQATFAASCITREEFKEELNQRFDDMDARRLQMHNHNAELLGALGTRIGGIDSRLSELRGDVKDVHKRIDEIKQ